MLRAGISLAWLNCGASRDSTRSSACSEISFPAHLSIRLVATASPRTEDTFGQSYLDEFGQGSYAYVYVGAIKSSSAARFVNTGDLLGSVAAHEIGHLLLGPNSHSTRGLMSATWQPAELQQVAKGILLFEPGQATRIRSRCLSVSARVSSAVQNPRSASGN